MKKIAFTFGMKKKKESNNAVNIVEPSQRKTVEIKVETVGIENVPRQEEDNHTQKLWNTAGEQNKENVQIIIRDVAIPERVYKVPAVFGVVLGRKQGDILLKDDKFVSSKHAIITYEAGNLFVCDLGSANGTFYQDKKIDGKTVILNGGIVKVGNTQLKVEYRKE